MNFKDKFIWFYMGLYSNIQELVEKAGSLAGFSLKQLAEQQSLEVPPNLLRHKGWIGDLLELALGADAGNKALPDFTELGVELKTLPISSQGKVLETTYVSIAPLTGLTHYSWEKSEISQKLKCILWVPIVSDKTLEIEERIIARPFLWSPSEQEWQILRQDWQEIMDMIALGDINRLNGRYGTYLHLRPKAANSRCLTSTHDAEGDLAQTLPRGFYLRVGFTQMLLDREYAGYY